MQTSLETSGAPDYHRSRQPWGRPGSCTGAFWALVKTKTLFEGEIMRKSAAPAARGAGLNRFTKPPAAVHEGG